MSNRNNEFIPLEYRFDQATKYQYNIFVDDFDVDRFNIHIKYKRNGFDNTDKVKVNSEIGIMLQEKVQNMGWYKVIYHLDDYGNHIWEDLIINENKNKIGTKPRKLYVRSRSGKNSRTEHKTTCR